MIVDLHTHILPEVDDGAECMEDALTMLEIAVRNGVTHLALTPHCNIPGNNPNYYDADLASRFKEMFDMVRESELNIELFAGMEVFANSQVPTLLKERKILTLNNTRYMLLEFGFNESVAFTFSLINRLLLMGCIPVIAHPERYPFVQENPNIVYEWIKMGACTQINKGSFLGRFGTTVGNIAMLLLQNDLATIIASDAHDVNYRSTHMEETYDYVKAAFSDEYAHVLFYENPRRIISNLKVLSEKPMPI